MIGSPGRPDAVVVVVSAEIVVVVDGVVVVVVDVGSRVEVVVEAMDVVVVDVVAAVLSGDPQATSSTVSAHVLTHDRLRLNSLPMF
jgi:hypothetical protein